MTTVAAGIDATCVHAGFPRKALLRAASARCDHEGLSAGCTEARRGRMHNDLISDE